MDECYRGLSEKRLQEIAEETEESRLVRLEIVKDIRVAAEALIAAVDAGGVGTAMNCAIGRLRELLSQLDYEDGVEGFNDAKARFYRRRPLTQPRPRS